jgi:uncharacterized membrane-anchored protein YhcB (DUF1043 family)
MSSDIERYSKTSSVMDVKLEYNGKVYKFNLYKELKIDGNSTTNQLLTHTTSYAFVAMLHKKLIIRYKEASKALASNKNRLIPLIKNKYNMSSLKEAEAHLYKNNKVIKEKEKELLRLEEVKDLMEVVVRSFEYRKDLLQTLSANIRKER